MKTHHGNATNAQRQLIERFINRDLGKRQSSLIGDLLKLADCMGGNDDLAAAFSIDNIENLYPNPEDWTVEQCREYLNDYCNGESDYPADNNPWNMDREELIEALEYDFNAELRAMSLDDLRANMASRIDDEDLQDGINDWRAAVLDNASAQEIYEWWPITDHGLVSRLRAMGQPVIDNEYGEWWGRTCSGQSISLDPTFWTIYQDAASREV
jgi:hypothetical protein